MTWSVKSPESLLATATLATLLAGCATAPTDPTAVAAPHLVDYPPAVQRQAADELEALPDDSAVGRMIADYGNLRDQVRALEAAR